MDGPNCEHYAPTLGRPKTMHSTQKGKAQHCVTQQGHAAVGTSAVLRKIQGYGGVQFTCRVPRAPRTRLTQAIVRIGTALLMSPQLSCHSSCNSCSSNCKIHFRLACYSGLPRSCVHGAVTSTLGSHLDLHRSLLRVVFVRLHGCPAMLVLRPVPAAAGDERFCLHCVVWIVLTVHLHQSKSPLKGAPDSTSRRGASPRSAARCGRPSAAQAPRCLRPRERCRLSLLGVGSSCTSPSLGTYARATVRRS